jgi:hypothetical protein
MSMPGSNPAEVDVIFGISLSGSLVMGFGFLRFGISTARFARTRSP